MAANRYQEPPKPRPLKTPPHISLQALRTVSDKRLDDIVALVNEQLNDDKPFTRGALSAIEKGIRGASPRILRALEVAYGLRDGDLTTNYEPRLRKPA